MPFKVNVNLTVQKSHKIHNVPNWISITTRGLLHPRGTTKKRVLPIGHQVKQAPGQHSPAELYGLGAYQGWSSGSHHKAPPADGTRENKTTQFIKTGNQFSQSGT